MELWERFTGHARRAVLLAHDEATKAKVSEIGTEHLLLGLVRLDMGVAVEVLSDLEVDLQDLRAELRKGMEMGTAEEAKADITASAQKALHFAFTEAETLGHSHIGTEHLLMGLMREGGTAAQALSARGVDRAGAQEVMRAKKPEPQREFKGPVTKAREAAAEAEVRHGFAQGAVRDRPQQMDAELRRLNLERSGLRGALAERSREAVLARHQRLAGVFLVLFLIGIGAHLLAVLCMIVPEQGAGGLFAGMMHVDVQTYNLAMLYFVGAWKLGVSALGVTALYHYLNVRALRTSKRRSERVGGVDR
ncbi:MAG: Clp protease N-terminal domain-containing protein [Armatimonadota bacterium]